MAVKAVSLAKGNMHNNDAPKNTKIIILSGYPFLGFSCFRYSEKGKAPSLAIA